MTSEVPGLEGAQLKEGSAMQVMAGAAAHWHRQCLRARRRSYAWAVCWFVLGALSSAAGAWWLR